MLELDAHAQMFVDDIEGIAKQAKELRWWEPLEVAKAMKTCEIDPALDLAAAWQIMQPALSAWLPTPDHCLIAVFWDGDVESGTANAFGGHLIAGDHPNYSTQRLLGAAELIERYFGVSDSAIIYYVVEPVAA